MYCLHQKEDCYFLDADIKLFESEEDAVAEYNKLLNQTKDVQKEYFAGIKETGELVILESGKQYGWFAYKTSTNRYFVELKFIEPINNGVKKCSEL